MKNCSHSTKAVDHALRTLGGANSNVHTCINYVLFESALPKVEVSAHAIIFNIYGYAEQSHDPENSSSYK